MATAVACKALLANGQDSLNGSPEYVELDSNQISGFTSHRGRVYLTDRTDAGTAQIQFNDKTGLLDPTNVDSPLYPPGPVPNSPAQLQLLNPVAEVYVPVFTGLTQSHPQTVRYQGARMNQGSIPLADLFSLLAIDEVPPGLDFDDTGDGTYTTNVSGDTTFSEQTVQDRILALLAYAGVPAGPATSTLGVLDPPTPGLLGWINSGNVAVQNTVYSPGDYILAALQDAADAEFPGVSNLYVDKNGVLMFKGRLARFIPDNYGVTTWYMGDKEGVETLAGLDIPAALIAADDFVIDVDVAKIINNALFSPENVLNSDIASCLIPNVPSINQYGPRPITGQNLIVAGQLAGALYPPSYANAVAVCQMFGEWYVGNFNGMNADGSAPAPYINISQVKLRPVPITAFYAAHHWTTICQVELGDIVALELSTPYGGGFTAASPTSQFFVEGITYQLVPGGTVPNVIVTLDLSPAYPYLSGVLPDNWDPGS